MSAAKDGKRGARRLTHSKRQQSPPLQAGDNRRAETSQPDGGILAALRDTLTALRSETMPKLAHVRPRELALCWREVFNDLEKLESAFLFQAELSQALAAAPRNVAAAKRVPALRRKAEELHREAVGPLPPVGAPSERNARSRRHPHA